MELTQEQIWKEIKSYLNIGLSLIPVKEMGDRPKTPCQTTWKPYQSVALTEGELYQAMIHYKTNSVAVVTGAVSGNLEIIDVDTKYNPGFDAILFKEIKDVLPHLWDKLRIHTTTSGGAHILYKIEGHAPEGNKKLADRHKTEEEIAESPNKGKFQNFLESRGEGGYAVIPPSFGYKVMKDNPIPVITWEERQSLWNICRSFNENIKVITPPKPTKSQSDFYSLNPFEDYDNRCDPHELMLNNGWAYARENNRFIHFTRPGADKKAGEISASFIREKCKFHIFTSSTQIENDKSYSPSTLLAEIQFNGDKSKTYKYLCENGYGKINRNVEQKIIKNAVIAGKPIPENVSEEGKKEYAADLANFKSYHPYGTFWTIEDDKFKISREDLYNVCYELGFRQYKGDVVQITGRFVNIISTGEFFDLIKDYIKEEEVDIYISICNAYESFIQSSGAFTISRLRDLNTEEIINDTQSECYKFYNNKCIRVTAHEIKVMDYEEVEGMIWSHKMLNRDYPLDGVKSSGLYESYLTNSTGFTDNVKKIIGYLCHDFKSEAGGYIVVMTEKVINPKDGGGSGKNIFGNILRNMITVCTVPGSAVQFNEKFLQSWNRQRIYFLADIPKKIDWLFLKEPASGFGLLKKLYKNEEEISPEDMPKLLLNTNYSYEDVDGGLKRRIIPIEFTDFYTLNGGVDVVHGKMFPSGFDKEDWADFDRIVLECIRISIENGGKLNAADLSEVGWEKKFKSNFNESTYEFIHENIKDWCNKGFISNTLFNARYTDYCNDIDLNPKYKASSTLMNNALEDYCKRYNITFERNSRSNGQRGRQFLGSDFPF